MSSMSHHNSTESSEQSAIAWIVGVEAICGPGLYNSLEISYQAQICIPGDSINSQWVRELTTNSPITQYSDEQP